MKEGKRKGERMASTSRWLLSEWVEMMNGKGYVSVISWLAKMMEACGLLGGVIQGFQLGVGDSGLAEDRQGFSRAQLVITPVQNTEDRLETVESPSLTPVFVQRLSLIQATKDSLLKPRRPSSGIGQRGERHKHSAKFQDWTKNGCVLSFPSLVFQGRKKLKSEGRS